MYLPEVSSHRILSSHLVFSFCDMTTFRILEMAAHQTHEEIM
jgi:hypothetical protein